MASASRPVIPARTPLRRALVAPAHDVVDARAARRVAAPDDERARDVGAVAVDLGAEIDAAGNRRARSRAADDRACGSAERGPRRDDRRERKALAALVAQRLLEHAGDPARVMPARTCGSVRSSARVATPAAAAMSAISLRVLSLAQRLDEIDASAATASARPLRAAAGSRGAADAPTRSRAPRRRAICGELLPQPRPQALRLDRRRARGRRLRRRPASGSGNR